MCSFIVYRKYKVFTYKVKEVLVNDLQHALIDWQNITDSIVLSSSFMKTIIYNRWEQELAFKNVNYRLCSIHFCFMKTVWSLLYSCEFQNEPLFSLIAS
jgi:hypothetical protein